MESDRFSEHDATEEATDEAGDGEAEADDEALADVGTARGAGASTTVGLSHFDALCAGAAVAGREAER